MTWKRSLPILALILIAAVLFLRPGERPFEERRAFLMGTAVLVRAQADEAALDETMALLRDLDRSLSAHSESSEIGRANGKSGTEVSLSPRTARLVQRALLWAERTGGAFDPTVLPLTRLWRGDGLEHEPPSPEAVAEALRHVGWSRVRLDGKKLFLEPAMGLDLGGIAKGYGADEAVSLLRHKGVSSALVDLGGNIVVIGERPGGGPWRIGIQDPRKPRGERLGIVEVRDRSVVSSGNYERFLLWQGERYGHIVDPATGFPARSDLEGVTVLSESSLDGDALATALFVLGRERALALTEDLERDGYAFILVGADRRIDLSPSLTGLFRLEAEEYRLETGR